MNRLVHATLVATVLAFTLAGCASTSATSPNAAQSVSSGTTALELSGTLEAQEIAIASEIGGRIIEVAAEKGDSVEPGALLVRLDDALLLEQRAQAVAAADEARAALEATEAQLAMALAGARSEEIDSARSVLRAAEANVALATNLKEVAELRVEAAEAEVEAARAQLAAAQAGLSASEADLSRAESARAKGEAGATPEEITLAERQLERAKNELWAQQSLRDAVCGSPDQIREISCDMAQARVQAAEEMVNIAQVELQRVREGLREEDLAALTSQIDAASAGVDGARAQVAAAQARLAAAESARATAQADVQSAQAQIDAATAERDRAQATLDLVLAGARSEEIDLLRSGTDRARAALAGAEAAVRAIDVSIGQLTLVSPIRGEVIQTTARAGELATPGAPLVILGDLQKLTLKVYVPQADLGRVSLGQTVEVSVDAYRDTFTGRVTHIASRAEFTPTHVETREERVKMVFAVEITLDNPDLLLKPGMPADVVFR